MANNPFVDVLSVVARHLEDVGATYAVTGSVVSSLYGEPVISQDIDICVRISADQMRRLDESLPSRFYRSRDAMESAANRNAMANLIDTATALKVDLSALGPTAYFDSVMARRRKVQFDAEGTEFWTVSPEDIVLMKLDWRRDSKSQKQWDNALSVVRTRGRRLDFEYLRDWAGRLDLTEELERLISAAGI